MIEQYWYRDNFSRSNVYPDGITKDDVEILKEPILIINNIKMELPLSQLGIHAKDHIFDRVDHELH